MKDEFIEGVVSFVIYVMTLEYFLLGGFNYVLVKYVSVGVNCVLVKYVFFFLKRRKLWHN